MRIIPLSNHRSHPLNGRRAWIGGLLLGVVAAVTASTAVPAAAAPQSAAVVASQAHQTQLTSGGASNPNHVTWSVLPATPTGVDRSRNLFNYGIVKPGSTILDHVEIVNHSKQSAAFSIYGTDATGTSPQNALLLLSAGKKPTDIGSWVTFPGGASELGTIIPGGKAIVVLFTVKIPLLATPGDHTGALVAAVGIPKKTANGLAVVENYRIAVPIEMRVPGALRAGIQVQSMSGGFSVPLNPAGSGTATISYTVANVGNVKQTGAQEVTVTGPFGEKATVHPPKLPTILPGDSIRVTVPVSGLYPAGPMTAKVTVTPSWPPRTIALTSALKPVNGSASLFAMPWALLGLILLLIAIGFAVWWLLRWRRREHQAEVSAAAARASRETERRLLASKPAAAAAAAVAPTPGAQAQGETTPGTESPGADASSGTATE